MTRDEVLALKPGPELDALVAEKVMSWRHVPSSASGNLVQIEHFLGHDNEIHVAWMPSKDIAAAWEVVEKMMQEYDVSLWSDRNGKWACEINYVIVDDCDTAHEAICKAALLAVMDGEDENNG